MTETFNIENYDNATVYDQNNEKVGTVKEVYLDDQTGEPNFVTVSTGFFGMKETFVPLDAASRIADGDLKVPFTKDFIKDAPNIDPDGHLDPAQEREIFEYYSLDRGTGRRGAATPPGDTVGGVTTDPDIATTDPAASEQAVAHEERLVVDKQEQVAGKVRLRKRVVTEHQQVDVPVEREELVVERETIDPDSPAARSGGIDSTEESEETITLRQERPVVGKETVATEKVNVGKRKVVDTETVEGEVRKEEIDVETDIDHDRGDTAR